MSATHIILDVEADGPCPGLYSMLEVGLVVADGKFDNTFQAQFCPVTDKYDPYALAAIERTREETLTYVSPLTSTMLMKEWLEQFERPIIWSDNPAFDWQFFNYYLHFYTGSNPCGFSARRIGDLYSGIKGNLRSASEWKRLRETKHTHTAVDDAKGNAEALWKIMQTIR